MSTVELPPFPCERPVPSELERWFKEVDRIADTSEAGFLLRGETPPSLQQYARSRDITGLKPTTVPSGTDVKPETILNAIKYNDYVSKAINEEVTRKATHKQGLVKIQRTWAAALSKALTDTAPLLLRDAEQACIIDLVPGSFDGIAMHAFIKKGRSDVDAGSRKLTFGLWHQKKYAEMQGTKLPDRCTTDEFTEKWNRFIKDHLPHFVTIKMDEEQMARALVDFMPEALRREGQSLLREYSARTDKYKDLPGLLSRCVELVGSDADPERENARFEASILPEEQRIAALKVLNKPHYKASPTAATAGNNSYKLPEGRWCSQNSCHLRHDETHPGEPCRAHPSFTGPLPRKVLENAEMMKRLLERREIAAKHLSEVTGKSVQPSKLAGVKSIKKVTTHKNKTRDQPTVALLAPATALAVEESPTGSGQLIELMPADPSLFGSAINVLGVQTSHVPAYDALDSDEYEALHACCDDDSDEQRASSPRHPAYENVPANLAAAAENTVLSAMRGPSTVLPVASAVLAKPMRSSFDEYEGSSSVSNSDSKGLSFSCTECTSPSNEDDNSIQSYRATAELTTISNKAVENDGCHLGLGTLSTPAGQAVPASCYVVFTKNATGVIIDAQVVKSTTYNSDVAPLLGPMFANGVYKGFRLASKAESIESARELASLMITTTTIDLSSCPAPVARPPSSESTVSSSIRCVSPEEVQSSMPKRT